MPILSSEGVMNASPPGVVRRSVRLEVSMRSSARNSARARPCWAQFEERGLDPGASVIGRSTQGLLRT